MPCNRKYCTCTSVQPFKMQNNTCIFVSILIMQHIFCVYFQLCKVSLDLGIYSAGFNCFRAVMLYL